MIKRILVPLDASPFTEAAVELAAVLAARHDAEIGGMVVLDAPGIEKSVGAIPVGGLYYAERRIAGEEKRFEEATRKLIENFDSACQRLSVRHHQTQRQGSPAEMILIESRFYDCVVMGLRTYFSYRSDAGADHIYGTKDDHTGKSLEKLMDHSAVPLLAVPMSWRPPERKLNALVAFDGSIPSVRSLHAFTQMFDSRSASVTVLFSHPEMDEARHVLDPAVRYLNAYGFEQVQAEWTPVSVRDAIAETYAATADLIVLGAHSRSALHEFILGSLCRDLIERANKVLLIAH